MIDLSTEEQLEKKSTPPPVAPKKTVVEQFRDNLVQLGKTKTTGPRVKHTSKKSTKQQKKKTTPAPAAATSSSEYPVAPQEDLADTVEAIIIDSDDEPSTPTAPGSTQCNLQ